MDPKEKAREKIRQGAQNLRQDAVGRLQVYRERMQEEHDEEPALRKTAEPYVVAVDRVQLFTIPNLVSFLRVALLPFYGWAIQRGESWTDGLALVVLLTAGLTDFLDGFLARRLRQATALGRIADPLADKIAITGAVIVLIGERGFPWWALPVLLLRDLTIVTVSAVFIKRKRIVFGPNILGKFTTFALGCLLVAYTLRLYFVAPYLLGAVLFGIVASGYSYWGRLQRFLAEERTARAALSRE